ncbi:DUF4097 family beta strand repeat-containing protein [Prauserella muralis]|uniref:DUF4097 domain-containing protein n=1 Tax=Prauserella muralis TaxID=588067 RepID=A0A2V4B8E5_9PSEU|nr:DUF4097 family beta strand repeat-containing protein [Prauserella muralis]PXY31528.1 hypothetical protein BAY60_03900 [Prauserella muralis]TWE14123.1 putative adhesin [Prauserella muralis]
MGRAGLAVGGVALIGVGVAVAFGWLWPSTAEATAELDQPVSTVRVAGDSGDVTIRAADVDAATVRQVFRYRWDRPGDAYSVEGTTLVLGACEDWSCSVDYEVLVPSGTTVTGNVDSGELTIEGVASADVEADSGDIDVRDVAGPVTVRLDSGSFTGEGLSGTVEADLSSGDVDVTLSEPGDVRVSVDSGDVRVAVPEGDYRVDGDSDSGDRDIEITQDPSAGNVLDLGTDSGDVTVTRA